MNQGMVQVASADGLAGCDHPGSDIDANDARIWAARIAERWRASVQSIIDVGRLLIEAKERMAHGAFGAMCEGQLPFSASTAQRLMAIARDNRLSNPAHVQLLPASWGTLYELTKLSDDEFQSAIAQHVIRPDMLRGEAELIRPLTRPHSSDGGVESRHAQETRARSDAPPIDGSVATQAGVAPGPSENQMPSGGLAIAHRRLEPTDGLDFFPTPLWATRALFEHVLVHLDRKKHCKLQRAWEPACGEGHMAEVLQEYFRDVHATDIADYDYGIDGVDFLDDLPDIAWDWIITNPPFNDSAEFVLRALERARTGVAMFVRLTWLESVGRYEKIFSRFPPSLIAIFSERVPLHKGRWEGDGTTMTAYIWLVWIKGMAPQAPFWIPPGCRERLTKPDDAKRFGSKPGEAA